MRRAIALLLAVLVSLTACGKNNSQNESAVSTAEHKNQNRKKAGNSSKKSETDRDPSIEYETEPAAALTLADGEVKLIYVKDNYIAAAFHGPDKEISAYFCDENGEDINAFAGYGHPSDDWTLIVSREFPEDYDLNELGVCITDHSAEPDADGRYPKQNYFNIEFMTEEEEKAIGLEFLDGHCCLVGSGSTMYSGGSFGLTFGITWFDDYYFSSFREMDGFADRFSYFAGDDTPLEDYFDGYSTLEITPMINMFDVMLIEDGGAGGKEKNKSMCKELTACKPYLIYTGLDGTEQRFDLLTE